ncbi:MAG: alpha/beta fold hydrolase [Bdellovibrionia bacterium]
METVSGGRNWIFLRGLMRGRGHWADFYELFTERFPQDKVELIDLPGNGERHLESSPTQISEFVNDLRVKSEFLQMGQSVNILALSLGGMIALEWAQQFPDEVESIHLVCTSTSSTSNIFERLQPAVLPHICKMAFLTQNAQAFEEHILKMISNNHDRQIQLLPQLTEYSEKYPVKLENFFRQIMAASQYQAPESPRVRTQIIGSWGDRMVSPQCSVKLAQKFGLEAVMHPWSGHDIPIDDPQWLLAHLDES